MSLYAQYKRGEVQSDTPHYSMVLMDKENGCVNNCMMGLNEHFNEEYREPGVHPDFQEGFLVLSGMGWAKIGEEEIRLVPDVAYLAPAGTAHAVKKDKECESLKIFWFHAAV